jgi:hypothetical protein
VALWTGKADIEHIETVGAYLIRSGMFRSLEAVDASPSSDSDPLYVVKASVIKWQE